MRNRAQGKYRKCDRTLRENVQQHIHIKGEFVWQKKER